MAFLTSQSCPRGALSGIGFLSSEELEHEQPPSSKIYQDPAVIYPQYWPHMLLQQGQCVQAGGSTMAHLLLSRTPASATKLPQLLGVIFSIKTRRKELLLWTLSDQYRNERVL